MDSPLVFCADTNHKLLAQVLRWCRVLTHVQVPACLSQEFRNHTSIRLNLKQTTSTLHLYLIYCDSWRRRLEQHQSAGNQTHIRVPATYHTQLLLEAGVDRACYARAASAAWEGLAHKRFGRVGVAGVPVRIPGAK